MLKKFKPAKCKTALNLAKSRIKLLKNKKDIQVKQLRREVAQLLDSGQDQTARIRVEHVVREEKTMAAFELIEIYCELVVARLPIVESQKNCPLDLKEAITSLIFAAPRCGDIPELQDVRKHFIAKYGKEFVTAATELRPDCGVSRHLVEKLSVKAPDGPAKVKILTAIAQEHNIKWEPNWFKDEDPMPSIEMPKQQRTEKPGMIQMEPLNFEIADDIQQPRATESSSQSYSHANIAANDVPPSSTSRPDGRLSGSSFDRMARNDFETSRPNWTMEFKDATAAAQAAAESAEHASMAARAAAEFSRRSNVVNNTSSGSLPSPRHDRNEGQKVFSNTSFNNQRSPRMQQVDQVGGYEHRNNVNNTSSTPLASSGHDRNEGKKVFSNTSFNNQRSPRMQVDQVGGYEQDNLTKGTDARGFKEDYTDSRVQYGSKKEYYRESEDSINPLYQEVRQSRDPLPTPSAREHEYDVFESPKHQKYENVHGDDFSLHEDTVKMKVQPGSFEAESSAFEDEYGIFSNLNNRNKENYSNDEYHGSSNQQTANSDDWHAKTAFHSGIYDSKADRGDRDGILDSVDQKYGFNSREDIFASMDHKTSEMDNITESGTKTDIRTVFDDSGSDDNEPIFDFAEQSYDLPSPVKYSPKHSAFHQENQSSFSSHPHNTLDVSESFRDLYAKLSEPVPVEFDSDGESLESEREVENEKTTHRVILVNDDDRKHHVNPEVSGENEESRSVYSHSTVKHKFDAGDLYTRQPSYERPISREESHDFDRPEFENKTQSGAEGGMELNFGKMPGGLRNRRQWDPPYRRGTVLDASSSPKSSRAGIDRALNFQDSSSEAESTKVSVKTSTEKGSNNEEIPYSPTIHETVHKTQKDPYFYSKDSSSSDDNTPKEPTMSRTLMGAGLSRRTKGSATRSVPNSQPSAALDRIPDSSFHTPEISRKIQTQTSSSRTRPNTKVSEDVYSAPSPTTEKQLTPKRETEIPRASSSSEKAPSRENPTKKPDHVHPKLPDFETFTAHMQSLKTNRQN